MCVFVTGIAGFIGYHVANELLNRRISVVGIDNLNPYYDIKLKNERLKLLYDKSININTEFKFYKGDILDAGLISNIFDNNSFSKVVHLAAQAGVRYSIENPKSYIDSNLVGFSNIIESCREKKINNLIYASSSSVYGGNENIPFKENQGVDHPVSLYAATKKANELIAHSYSHLY